MLSAATHLPGGKGCRRFYAVPGVICHLVCIAHDVSAEYRFINASSGELILVEILEPQAPRQELAALPRAPLQLAIADYPMILGDTG